MFFRFWDFMMSIGMRRVPEALSGTVNVTGLENIQGAEQRFAEAIISASLFKPGREMLANFLSPPFAQCFLLHC
jgi:hypothetical protein